MKLPPGHLGGYHVTSCHQRDVSRNAIDYIQARTLRKQGHVLHALPTPLAVDSEVLEDPKSTRRKETGSLNQHMEETQPLAFNPEVDWLHVQETGLYCFFATETMVFFSPAAGVTLIPSPLQSPQNYNSYILLSHGSSLPGTVRDVLYTWSLNHPPVKTPPILQT